MRVRVGGGKGKVQGVSQAGGGRGGARGGGSARGAGAAAGPGAACLEHSGVRSEGVKCGRRSRQAGEAQWAPGARVGVVRKLGTQSRCALGFAALRWPPSSRCGLRHSPGSRQRRSPARRLDGPGPCSRFPGTRLERVERGRKDARGGEEAAPRQGRALAPIVSFGALQIPEASSRVGWPEGQVAGSEVERKWMFVHVPGGGTGLAAY